MSETQAGPRVTDQIYIWIPSWDGPEGFQHYKTRDPIWIKNYTRLTGDDDYLKLTFARRGLLHGIWLERARGGPKLPSDTRTLSQRLGQKVTSRDLEALNHAGFIELIASSTLAERLQAASDAASKPLALTRAGALARGEQRREETPPGVFFSPNGPEQPPEAAQQAAPPAPGTNGHKQETPAIEIATRRITAIGADLPPQHLDDELRDALGNRYPELTTVDRLELHRLHASLLPAEEPEP